MQAYLSLPGQWPFHLMNFLVRAQERGIQILQSTSLGIADRRGPIRRSQHFLCCVGQGGLEESQSQDLACWREDNFAVVIFLRAPAAEIPEKRPGDLVVTWTDKLEISGFLQYQPGRKAPPYFRALATLLVLMAPALVNCLFRSNSSASASAVTPRIGHTRSKVVSGMADWVVGDARMDECKRNLKYIATNLEMYASDNVGRYPPDLQMLSPAYLKPVPTCPSAGFDTYSPTYVSTANPDFFRVWCSGHYHSQVSADSPYYNSLNGVLPDSADALARSGINEIGKDNSKNYAELANSPPDDDLNVAFVNWCYNDSLGGEPPWGRTTILVPNVVAWAKKMRRWVRVDDLGGQRFAQGEPSEGQLLVCGDQKINDLRLEIIVKVMPGTIETVRVSNRQVGRGKYARSKSRVSGQAYIAGFIKIFPIWPHI